VAAWWQPTRPTRAGRVAAPDGSPVSGRFFRAWRRHAFG